MKTGIVVLAAGASTRLGTPKQLLRFGNKHLIQHIIDACVKSDFDKTAVVLGYHYPEIKAGISYFSRISILHNKQWKEGMSTSIKMGLQHFYQQDAVGFCTVDQVFLNSHHLNQMIKKFKSTDQIISSYYKQTYGTPCLFGRDYYNDIITSISGDRGAKKIIETNKKSVIKVPFKDGEFDIDTPNDLEILN